MMTFTNADALLRLMEERGVPDKLGLALEIVETFRLGEGANPWVRRPFIQRARKRAATDVRQGTPTEATK